MRDKQKNVYLLEQQFWFEEIKKKLEKKKKFLKPKVFNAEGK